MKYTKTQMRTALLIDKFTPLTHNDEVRLAKAKERLIIDVKRLERNEPTDSGLYGKVSEILGQSKHAKSKDVHGANTKDGFIFVDGVRYSLEHKTNYTCIEEWYFKSEEWQKTHYIRYTIDDYTKAVTNKKTGHTTPSKRLYFEGVLTFYDLFAIGERFGAIKPHKCTDGQTRIYFRHGTKICKYLNSLDIVPYERNGRYTFEDFILG